jgi:DNA-binding LytR/AlgR family response regulator
MSLRTLIVDDEPIARRVLREELDSLDGVEIVGEAENGVVALKKISEHHPDLVLLDLQMPGMGGLEVVRSLRHGAHMPVIVIVTAYDQYALQAFEAGAIDYLLKPVGEARLADAVAPRTRRIVGKIGQEYFLLSADEIYAFQAECDTVWIVTAKKKYLATQTLKVLDQRLKSTNFRRIHRNALVNVDHVRKMSALSSQRWLITLSNNQEFIVSKRQAGSVRQLLNW